MDGTGRGPLITEDQVRALQFSAGDVAEIEQTILSFFDACHTRKIAMVVGNTINTLKDRDRNRWRNLSDIYCAYLIRFLVFVANWSDTVICSECVLAKLNCRLKRHECTSVYFMLHLVLRICSLDSDTVHAGQRMDD